MEVEMGNLLDMLYLCKSIYDHDPDSWLFHAFDEVCEDDYYDFILNAFREIFEDVNSHYREDEMVELTVLRDPAMYRYYSLAKEYGRICGVTEEQNPYFKKAAETVRYQLQFSGWDYDYDVRTGTVKERDCMIVFAMGMDFFLTAEVVIGLQELLDFYKEGAEELEKKLAKLRKRPARAPARKEAAA